MVEPAVLVGLGGAAGAVCRYWVGQRVSTGRAPFGTFAVNVTGSFLLGLVAFGGFTDPIVLLVGVGFCGAFTTFATFSVDVVLLWEDGRHGLAAAFGFGTLAAALLAVGVARALVA